MKQNAEYENRLYVDVVPDTKVFSRYMTQKYFIRKVFSNQWLETTR